MPFKPLISSAGGASAALYCLTQFLPAATVDDLTYLDTGTSITITHCSQTATGILEIPAVLDDKPVTAIGNYAFSMCNRLTRVTLPSSVTRIGDRSFYQCYGLTQMTVPPGVTSIGSEAFFYCDGLTSVTLGAGLTVIGDSTFKWCTSLKSVTIPASVTRIGNFSFLTCSALKKATFLGNAPIMDADVFNEIPAGFKIYFRDGAKGFTTPTWLGYPSVRIKPEISIQQPFGTELKSSASVRNLGNARIFTTGTTLKFIITNRGKATLSGLAITQPRSAATEFIVDPPALTALPPGDSTSFKVTFKPVATGTRTTSLRVKNNDSDENPFVIKLTGTGFPR